MDWIVVFLDCAGNEILDYRKYIKDKTRAEAMVFASELEDQLYQEDDSVDFFQLQEDIPIPEEEYRETVQRLCCGF